jgi:hypothetical protein
MAFNCFISEKSDVNAVASMLGTDAAGADELPPDELDPEEPQPAATANASTHALNPSKTRLDCPSIVVSSHSFVASTEAAGAHPARSIYPLAPPMQAEFRTWSAGSHVCMDA